MPKEKKTTKKSRVTIENDGNTIEQVFDYGKFKKMFEQWKTDCGKSGEDLHTKSTTTLFTTVTNHGKSGSHRPQSRDKSTIGAGEIVEKLDKLISDAEELENADEDFLDKAVEQLKQVEKKYNPRNILFTVPIWSRVNRKNLRYDEETDVQQIYGHYRTSDYIKFRNRKAELRENVDKETLPAVPKAWYSTEKNKAKPPLWQALFATGDGDVVSTGLLSVLQEAKGLMKETVLEHLKLKIDDDGKGATAADVWELGEVKQWLKTVIGTSSNPGTGIHKTTGMFRDDHLTRALSRDTFDIKSFSESNFAKEIAGFEDLIGKLKTYQITISRRQMRNLGILAGLKRTPGKQTVYMPGVAKEEKVKKMDWKSILKSQMNPVIRRPSEGQPIMINEEEMWDMPKCRRKAVMKNPWASGQLCRYHFNHQSSRQPQRGLGMKHWVPIDQDNPEGY